MRKCSFVFALCFLLSACRGSDPKIEEEAQEIRALRLSTSDLPISIELVGQTKGSVDAEIRARVDGVITAIHFEEGRQVTKGQALYSIDPAPFRAKAAEAKAKVAEAQASLVKAQSDLKRIRPLVKIRAMSERDLDRAVAEEQSSLALVEAANAALEAAQIELSYCEIAAPISGTIGLSAAKIGEYVGRPPNPVVLNTVSQLNPIHVLFSLSEEDYLTFMRSIQAGEKAPARELRMLLADGSEYDRSGNVVSLGRAIDPNTGTIPIEAAFPNPAGLIRPGQFAKVKTLAHTLHDVIVIPKKALRELQGQYQAVVIGADNTAELRNVVPGPAVGEQQVIEQGLKAQEIIALEGIQQLQAGTRVTPNIVEQTG